MDTRDYILGGSISEKINKNIDDLNKSYLNSLQNKIDLKEQIKNNNNNNEFLNLTMNDIYNNIINLLPNLYNDYYKEYLRISLEHKNNDKDVSENIIIRDTIKFMIFNNKNMIYVGFVLIIITFFLYIIKL